MARIPDKPGTRVPRPVRAASAAPTQTPMPTLQTRAPQSAAPQTLSVTYGRAQPRAETLFNDIFFEDICRQISQWLDLRSCFSLALTDKAKWKLLSATVQRHAIPLRQLMLLRRYQCPRIESAMRHLQRVENGWENPGSQSSKSGQDWRRKLSLQTLHLQAGARKPGNTKESYLAALSALTHRRAKVEFLHLILDTSWSDADILAALGKLLARAQLRIFIRLEYLRGHSEKLYRLLAQRQGPTHLECMFNWCGLPQECRDPCLALARSGHLHGLHVPVHIASASSDSERERMLRDLSELCQTKGIVHLSLNWAVYDCRSEVIAGMIREYQGLQSLVLMPKTELGEKDWKALIPAIFANQSLNMARVVDYTWGGTPSVRHLLSQPVRYDERNLCLEIGASVTNWKTLLDMLKSNPDLTMLRLMKVGELDRDSDAELARTMREHPLLELHIYSQCVTDSDALRENHRHMLEALLDLPPHRKLFIHCSSGVALDLHFFCYSMLESPQHVSLCFAGGWHKEGDTEPEWYLRWLKGSS